MILINIGNKINHLIFVLIFIFLGLTELWYYKSKYDVQYSGYCKEYRSDQPDALSDILCSLLLCHFLIIAVTLGDLRLLRLNISKTLLFVFFDLTLYLFFFKLLKLFVSAEIFNACILFEPLPVDLALRTFFILAPVERTAGTEVVIEGLSALQQ